jgi:glyoxylase-like metal-dependent hydrolase (beta-lactamase superfamily II)
MQHLRGNLYAIQGKSVRLADGRVVLTANSIFIDDYQKAIIDPASDQKVLQDIAKRNEIPLCFLSHSHIDHLCSHRLFRNSTLLLHQDEDVGSDSIENATRSRRISKTRRLKEAIGIGGHASFERF